MIIQFRANMLLADIEDKKKITKADVHLITNRILVRKEQLTKQLHNVPDMISLILISTCLITALNFILLSSFFNSHEAFSVIKDVIVLGSLFSLATIFVGAVTTTMYSHRMDSLSQIDEQLKSSLKKLK